MEKIKCPICGEILTPRKQVVKPASSFNDCLRRCEKCLVGFSNSKENPTMIYKNYADNVPSLLHSDLEFVLSNSLNQMNRANKKNKFAFSTSEDALTWSFFKYFVMYNRLNDLLILLNIDSKETSFDIYLWGTNICSKIIDSDFNKQFIQKSDLFNEDSLKRTEPDVIIKLNDKLIFIEVKYQSANEVITDSAKFNKYLVAKIDYNNLIASGHYELYRNWAFASSLSNDSKFELINLGLSRLFIDKNKAKLKKFEDSLNSDNGKFVKLSWEQIIRNMNESEYDDWFLLYLRQKMNASP